MTGLKIATIRTQSCPLIYMCLFSQLCLTICDPMDCNLLGSSVHEDAPGKNTGMSCHVLLQGIFPTQALSPGLLHCRRILYQLTYQGGPEIQMTDKAYTCTFCAVGCLVYRSPCVSRESISDNSMDTSSETVNTSFLCENKFLFLLFKLLTLYWSIVN